MNNIWLLESELTRINKKFPSGTKVKIDYSRLSKFYPQNQYMHDQTAVVDYAYIEGSGAFVSPYIAATRFCSYVVILVLIVNGDGKTETWAFLEQELTKI